VLRVDGSPAVKEPKGHEVEGEIVTPICTWLIPVSADPYARKIAQKQRSCAAMSDNRNVAVNRLGPQALVPAMILRCASTARSHPRTLSSGLRKNSSTTASNSGCDR
jgi:hypothetical protein